MLGFLTLNKPTGVTSFSLVRKLRKLTGEKRVGFAGTLDPFAQGVLIFAIGRAYTRQLDHFHTLPKTYRFTWVLGIETTTLDPEGPITHQEPFAGDLTQLHDILPQFTGTISQLPPIFSAKKINGKPAYLSARKGEVPELKPVDVTIEALELLNVTPGEFPQIEMRMTCSKGTYVRSMVRDLAVALGSVGYCKTLIRESVGHHTLATAMHPETLTPETLPEVLTHEP